MSLASRSSHFLRKLAWRLGGADLKRLRVWPSAVEMVQVAGGRDAAARRHAAAVPRFRTAHGRTGNACGTGTRTADRSVTAARPARRLAVPPVRRRDWTTGRSPAARANRDDGSRRKKVSLGAISTTLPEIHHRHRSAMWRTTPRSCVVNSIDSLNSRLSSVRSSRICARTETSSADTGSSATMIRGLSASARPMAMRWRCPPENSCGKRSSRRAPGAGRPVRAAPHLAVDPAGRHGDATGAGDR